MKRINRFYNPIIPSTRLASFATIVFWSSSSTRYDHYLRTMSEYIHAHKHKGIIHNTTVVDPNKHKNKQRIFTTQCDLLGLYTTQRRDQGGVSSLWGAVVVLCCVVSIVIPFLGIRPIAPSSKTPRFFWQQDVLLSCCSSFSPLRFVRKW